MEELHLENWPDTFEPTSFIDMSGRFVDFQLGHEVLVSRELYSTCFAHIEQQENEMLPEFEDAHSYNPITQRSFAEAGLVIASALAVRNENGGSVLVELPTFGNPEIDRVLVVATKHEDIDGMILTTLLLADEQGADSSVVSRFWANCLDSQRDDECLTD